MTLGKPGRGYHERGSLVSTARIILVVVVLVVLFASHEGGQILHERLVKGSGRGMDFQDHDTCDTDGIVQTQPGWKTLVSHHRRRGRGRRNFMVRSFRSGCQLGGTIGCGCRRLVLGWCGGGCWHGETKQNISMMRSFDQASFGTIPPSPIKVGNCHRDVVTVVLVVGCCCSGSCGSARVVWFWLRL